MKLQQLLSYTRRAIDDFHMIQDGDIIAVGISGGKDSLALLYALHGLQRFYPARFQLKAITVDLGLGIQKLEEIRTLCESMDVAYHVVKTEIGKIIFDSNKDIFMVFSGSSALELSYNADSARRLLKFQFAH